MAELPQAHRDSISVIISAAERAVEQPRPLVGSHDFTTNSGQHLAIGNGPGAASTDLSAINDGGDEKRIEHDASVQSRHDLLSPSGELLYHAGDHFSEIQDLPQELDVPSPSLEEQLRNAFIKSAWRSYGSDETDQHEKKKFLPLNELDKIITEESVKGELQSWNMFNDETVIIEHVRNIVRVRTFHDRSMGDLEAAKATKTARKKLFAILILTGKERTIIDLIKEKIYDLHLPFALDDTEKLQHRIKDGSKTIEAFEKWGSKDHDLFSMYQWYMMAPWLLFSSKDRPQQISKYILDGKAPLPFIKDAEVADNEPAARGGFGAVRRVKIHPAHYPSLDSMSSTFAIKTLLENDPETFKIEMNAYKRLMSEANEHLTRLLVAIEHGTHRSLIFPWAEGGNLLQFWKTRSDVASYPPDYNWARWMAKQFSGMAGVLKQVHTPTKLDAPKNSQHLPPPNQNLTPDRTKKRGIHGDLKPENILWFIDSTRDDVPVPEDDGDGPKGILKVADFGLAAFLSKASYRRPAKGMAVSKTHRAPEYEEELVTPDADLWSFGCILLEFLVWYQYGMEGGIDRFSDQRADEESIKANEQYQEDKFFIEDVERQSARPSRVCFKVKDAVTEEIARLREGSKCSEFCSDVLDLIQDGLLRVTPQDRMKCEEMYNRLQGISEKAQKDVRYCVDEFVKTAVPTQLTASFDHDVSAIGTETPPSENRTSGDERTIDSDAPPLSARRSNSSLSNIGSSMAPSENDTLPDERTPLQIQVESRQHKEGRPDSSVCHRFLKALHTLFCCSWIFEETDNPNELSRRDG